MTPMAGGEILRLKGRRSTSRGHIV